MLKVYLFFMSNDLEGPARLQSVIQLQTGIPLEVMNKKYINFYLFHLDNKISQISFVELG